MLTNKMDLFDKAYACLASLAIGDAMGMPTEFMTPELIADNYGWVRDFVRPLDWHPHSHMQPGAITDDTGQAIAIAHAYADNGTLSPGDVARELIAWVDVIPEGELATFIGPSTSKALNAIKAGCSPGESGSSGKTNGGSMRVAPVGIVRHGDQSGAVADAYTTCIPTHNTGVAAAGAGAVAAAIAAAMTPDASLDTIIAAGKFGARSGSKNGNWAWGTGLDKRIELADRLVQDTDDEKIALGLLYDYVGVDMLVAESVATAFGIVRLAGGDPMKACALGANIGGDSDTIAAIAGAICGAWKGINHIDAHLLEMVLEVNKLDLASEAQRLVEIAGKTRGLA
ncbi:MAG: ADP-ribosylglycohydrolase family protein [Chloroflexota bacterium]|nr:ADP-ribosylglycohydrolase family protein [Chloroflexota bacterium]